MPPWNVPIEKLLKFREERRDSLLALRRGIRALTEQSNIDPMDLLEDIQLRIAEIDRLLSENFIQKWARRTSIILGLEDVRQSAILAALGEILGRSMKLPEGVGPLLGVGVSGTIQLAQKRVPAEYTLPERISDFYYVYAAAHLS
jgi:hypothetical protein